MDMWWSLHNFMLLLLLAQFDSSREWRWQDSWVMEKDRWVCMSTFGESVADVYKGREKPNKRENISPGSNYNKGRISDKRRNLIRPSGRERDEMMVMKFVLFLWAARFAIFRITILLKKQSLMGGCVRWFLGVKPRCILETTLSRLKQSFCWMFFWMASSVRRFAAFRLVEGWLAMSTKRIPYERKIHRKMSRSMLLITLWPRKHELLLLDGFSVPVQLLDRETRATLVSVRKADKQSLWKWDRSRMNKLWRFDR